MPDLFLLDNQLHLGLNEIQLQLVTQHRHSLTSRKAIIIRYDGYSRRALTSQYCLPCTHILEPSILVVQARIHVLGPIYVYIVTIYCTNFPLHKIGNMSQSP